MNKWLCKLLIIVVFACSLISVADLLDDATISHVDSQLNTSSWSSNNLIDSNRSTRWLSNKQTNDINFTFGNINGAACFDRVDLVNYGRDDRSIRRFALFRTLDNSLQGDSGVAGWTPIVADENPTEPIDYLSWIQGARITAIDSQLNSTTWAAEHVNDGDSASRWLSNKSNNVLEFDFDTDWDGSTGDTINVAQIMVSNYGTDDRSLNTFQVEVSSDGSTWRKLEVPGSSAGEPDFNFILSLHGASLSDIDDQLNSSTWAAENIHDGDNNSRWLNNRSNNILSFNFDVDYDGITGAAGDVDDYFTIESIYLRNYGTDDRSIQEFQVEYKTRENSTWTKLAVPGSSIGEPDFNYLLSLHGSQLISIDGELNSTTWGADNINDGDANSRWLNNRGNNRLEFVFDVDLDGTTGAAGDADDYFTIEKIYLKNYGVDDRSVKDFQIAVKTRTNSVWSKLRVPGSAANEPGYPFSNLFNGGRLDVIDSQLNASTWAAENIHDGDNNSRWLSNKQTNTLAFSFDTNTDDITGDAINIDTIELVNYGVDDRSIQTFEVDVQISGGAWQAVNAPGGGTVFTANMDGSGQSWSVVPLASVTAARIRTLTNHGDPSYTGARELIFSGVSIGPNYTFSAAMHGDGEIFTLDVDDRPIDVTDVRFMSINNHGDPSYTGAREFAVWGDSIVKSRTFTAAMNGTGETFTLDVVDRPSNVTEVRLLTINNHGDPSYTGAREFAVLGPSIGALNTFTLPMSTGPHTITLDVEDRVESIVAAKVVTISNHGDPSYTGLREFSLLGNAEGPSYIFDAEMNSSTQLFNFEASMGSVFRFHTLGNYGDPSYTGAAELILRSSNACIFGKWHLDESSWSGSNREVVDASGNNLHGTAINGASVGDSDPAISGNPGTCSYGEFDGQDDHIEITSAFPNLQNSFTITAWINAESLSSGARIFADDERNSTGYALSLGDGGNGRLRFFSRGVSPISVDTQSAIINANTWHFVAAVHDSVTRTRQIYVDGVAQVLTGGTTAPTYTGSWGTDIGNASIGGETNNAGENNANFRFQGSIDEVAVYSGALTASEIIALQQQSHSCSSISQVNHFAIDIGSASASTCLPKSILLTACATANCSSVLDNYTGTVSLSTSSNHGNWSESGAGSLLPVPDDDDNGLASYQFASDDNGVVNIELSNIHADALTVTVEDGLAGVSNQSDLITFSDNVFVITDDPMKIAGRPQSMRAALWANDGNQCAIATQYSGLKNLKAWIERDADDASGVAPVIGSLSLPNSVPTSDNLTTLNFINGEANFIFDTSDVGKYTFAIRDDSALFADAIIDGSSAMTIRPFGFYVDILGGNPGASNAQGGVFTAAGNNFSVAVTAVQWEAVDDSDNDGIPDGFSDTDPSNNANLSDNPATVSFGREQSGQAETVSLVGLGILPGGGVFDDSANVGNAPIIRNFTAGLGSTATARYSEVGIIEIKANLSDNRYLDGDNVLGASGYVGRFTPDHFILQSPIITLTGNNYHYLGQPFSVSFELVAENANGDTTQNYTGNFAKLTESYLNANTDYGAVDQASSTFMDGRTLASNHVLSESMGILTLANVDIVIDKLATVEGPLRTVQLGVDLVDSDGIELQLKNLDTSGDTVDDKVNITGLSSPLLFGRVFIPPIYGPETPVYDAALSPNAMINMPIEIQYYNGTQFVINTDDNNTEYNTWRWNLTDHCNDGTITCSALPANFSVVFPLLSTTVVEGRSRSTSPIQVTRPGIIGELTLGIDVDTWLHFDWSQTASEQDPETLITFGTYRGHDRIIYWREK